jgi:hypothetical protein
VAALAVSLIGNACVWILADLFGRVTIGLTEVLVFSLLGVAAGLLLRAVIARSATRPARTFLRVCVGVVLVYALGPPLAAVAPYMEGAPPFTLTTVLATEWMHLVSGASVALALVPGGPSPRILSLAQRLSARALGSAAILAIAAALFHLESAQRGLVVERAVVGKTPVTVFRPSEGPSRAVVLIAHGFAGSQQLMQPFATTFARNGYTAVTFDFPGHGRNPALLTGSVTSVDGATRTLVTSMQAVAAYARGLGAGPLAVLGHSMATDVVVRFAEEATDVRATIAVSMFSPAVTATRPDNLLVIVGDWEATLKREALRAVGLATSPEAPEPGRTYGDLSRGTGRRAAWSPHVEHVGVLFSPASMREALAWLDGTFGRSGREPLYLDARGPWILLLLLGIVALARPLAGLLPVVTAPPAGAGLAWSRLWLPVVVPAVVTPLVLRFVPTHFLPVLVGDYLAAHFATYGLLTWSCLAWVRSRAPQASGRRSILPAKKELLLVAGAALGLVLYAVVGLGAAIDRYVTSFVPSPGRATLILATLVGTLSFFLADEWLTRGEGAARGAYAATKVAFLLSLGLAVALDVQRLFFLLIIVPVIVAFFLMYGLFSAWVGRRTGNPFVAGVANAIGFAWAIGVTFPMLG